MYISSTPTSCLSIFCFVMLRPLPLFLFFFLNDPPPTEIYPLPLHDALPILLPTPGPWCDPLPAASPRNQRWTALSAYSLLPVPAPRPSPPRPRAAPPPPCRGLSAARRRGSEIGRASCRGRV